MAKLKALLLTEGYHGMISQVEGMAKALKAEFQHKIVRLNWLWNYVPPKLTPKLDMVLKDKNYMSNSEGFDLVISCGRKSVIPSIIIKKNNNKIFNIHIQNPKVSFNNFDIIIAPQHDELKGENVISSKGAIHYITYEEIQKYKSYLINKVNSEKIVTLILGGPNKYYNYDEDELIKIFNKIKINFTSKGYKTIIVRSLRTPQKTIELASKEFSSDSYIVGSVDKYAYLSALGLAEKIVVTCDSTSMISEAAITGKPIFVAHMRHKRNNHRFKKFFNLFKQLGIIRDLGEEAEYWTYEKLDEAERIAVIINSKLKS
tara:strand:+ start:1781 stop:2728 length:948 start_codon:yes stop_codon:yes gene_type:complete